MNRKNNVIAVIYAFLIIALGVGSVWAQRELGVNHMRIFTADFKDYVLKILGIQEFSLLGQSSHFTK